MSFESLRGLWPSGTVCVGLELYRVGVSVGYGTLWRTFTITALSYGGHESLLSYNANGSFSLFVKCEM